MSWQAYVDTNLVGTGKVSKAAILGLDGNVWAKSASLNIGAEEAKLIAQHFGKDINGFQAGIYCEGEKYMMIRAAERSVYGKKNKDGIVLVKTNMAIVIGVYKDPIPAPDATVVVEKFADYLVQNNY